MARARIMFSVHPGQKEVLHFKSRFKVVVAGRRWGKSKLAAITLTTAAASRPNSLVWYVAPTYGMCKSIMWSDLIGIIPRRWIVKSNETTQSITLINGSRIELKGCDKPDTLRGVGLHFLVVDEAQDIKKETWTTVLRPTLSDKQGGALIIGTPKGFNWLYDLYREGQKETNRKNGLWASWQFPTMSSPFIPPEEIEAAKRDMDEKVFNQEFNACHLPDTEIRLENGEIKKICEIKKGDKVPYRYNTPTNGKIRYAVVKDGGYTGKKDIIEVTLETGEKFKASYNHKIKNEGIGEIQLKDAEYLEKIITYHPYPSLDLNVAALLGYMLTTTILTTRQGMFGTVYRCFIRCANKTDAHWILRTLKVIGFGKYDRVMRYQSKHYPWAVALYTETTKFLLNKGLVIMGPRGVDTNCIPQWIENGSNEILSAYLSGLCGARMNKLVHRNHTKKMNPVQITISNINNTVSCDADLLWKIMALFKRLGIRMIIKEKHRGDKFASIGLFLDATEDENIVNFADKVNCWYSSNKYDMFWLAAHYLKTKLQFAKYRTSIFEDYKTDEDAERIKAKYNITDRYLNSIVGTQFYRKMVTCGYEVPQFPEWMAERYCTTTQALKLPIVKKELLPAQDVYNISINTKEHSYLLANGINNYNCFETMSGRVYFPFDRKIHVGRMYTFDPTKPIFVGMDFNVSPMTAAIMQPQYNGELWVVDEIVLYNSSTVEMADEIERRYWRYMKQISLFPDPAANQRHSSRGETDIDILRQKGFKKIYFRKAHPAVQDRINAVNKMLKSADSTVRLFINGNCKNVIDSLEQTLYKENSKEVDKTLNKEHITDALGYCVEYTNPVRNNIHIAMSI